MEKDSDGKDKTMRSTEKTVGEDEALGENGSKDAIRNDANAVSDSLAAPDTEPEADLETDMKEIPAAESVMETTEEKKCVDASNTENAKTPAGEETKPRSSNGKEASPETAMPELPKVKYPTVSVCVCVAKVRNLQHIN